MKTAKNNKKKNRIQKKKSWISATHLYNYMLNDTLVDWLKKRQRTNNNNGNEKAAINNNIFSTFLMKKGIEFEKKVVQLIHSKIPVTKISEKITNESINKTIAHMKKGTPILHSAPLRNDTNNTQGIADLLIRSDYINRLFECNPLALSDEKTPSTFFGSNTNTTTPYHYVVVDIKFTTLPLRADGELILNSKSFPAYKSQLLIYRDAVALIQGYHSPYSFILGRRWKYVSRGCEYSSINCLNKLGKIDFSKTDKKFIDETKKAIQWVENINRNGHKWKLDPPSKTELYPNMCIDSGIWNKEKEMIAEQLGEITSILYCGQKERELAFSKRIKSWKNPRFSSSIVNIQGQRGKIIDKILEINRQTKKAILPDTFQINTHNWQTPENEMFVDFETIADIFSPLDELPVSKKTDIIFMIGVYYKNNNNNWAYKKFVCKKNTQEDELKLLKEFNAFVIKHNMPKLWYWCADEKFWNQALKKNNIVFEKLICT